MTKKCATLKIKRQKLALLGSHVLLFCYIWLYNDECFRSPRCPRACLPHPMPPAFPSGFLPPEPNTEWRITFYPAISGLERLITKTYLIEIASEIVSLSPFNHKLRENSYPGSGYYKEIPNPGKTRAGILILRSDFSTAKFSQRFNDYKCNLFVLPSASDPPIKS